MAFDRTSGGFDRTAAGHRFDSSRGVCVLCGVTRKEFAFKLKGFDKDRIATVSDWDGGELATLAGDCNAGLSLRADAKASAEKIGAFSADKEYSSSDPAIRGTRPTITEILIGY